MSSDLPVRQCTQKKDPNLIILHMIPTYCTIASYGDNRVTRNCPITVDPRYPVGRRQRLPRPHCPGRCSGTHPSRSYQPKRQCDARVQL